MADGPGHTMDTLEATNTLQLGAEPPLAADNPWTSAGPASHSPTPIPNPDGEDNLDTHLSSADHHSTIHDPVSPLAQPALDVLSEFDPLVTGEIATDSLAEDEARAAWSEEEGHPPQGSSDLSVPATPGPGPPRSSSLPGQPQTPRTPQTADSLTSTATGSDAIPLTPNSTNHPPAPPPQTPISALRTSYANLTSTPQNLPSPTTLSSLAKPLRRASENEPPPDAAGSSAPVDGDVKIPPPFDFQKFLDQMKTRSAEPVAKYLRSFLHNFGKKTFTVHEQVKLIADFLAFISTKMRECDVWRALPPAEFDNAVEAMEKLVMNRLYHLTFTPQIDPAIYPITTDDLERDRILRQRIRLFGWVRESHLDIPVGEGSRGFIMFAEQELLKINHYKAPRDKLICILNACKVIFGLIRHLNREEGADAFIPILIYVVLQANPEHLLSNVEYISRFRSAQKLQSEAGYYLSSLMGAISFIETMDHTSLSNITQEEFERNVEDAIQSLSPSDSPAIPSTPRRPRPLAPSTPVSASPAAGEESARILTLPTTLAEDTRRFFQRTGDLAQQTISKPLNAIGKIFSDALDDPPGFIPHLPDFGGLPQRPGSHSNSNIDPETPAPGQQLPPPIAIQAPYKARIRRSPSSSSSPGTTPLATPSRPGPGGFNLGALAAPFQSGSPFSLSPFLGTSPSQAATPQREPTPEPGSVGSEEHAFDFSALSAEIDRAHDAAHDAGRDTLLQIFPGLDGEVADMVLEASNGDLGLSIDKLLEMGMGQ